MFIGHGRSGHRYLSIGEAPDAREKEQSSCRIPYRRIAANSDSGHDLNWPTQPFRPHGCDRMDLGTATCSIRHHRYNRISRAIGAVGYGPSAPNGLSRNSLNTSTYPDAALASASNASSVPKPTPQEPDLQAVIDVWPSLPLPLKAAVLALVRAAEGQQPKNSLGTSR